MLPVEQFPSTVAFARELTAGEGHDRFDHTLRLVACRTSTTPRPGDALLAPRRRLLMLGAGMGALGVVTNPTRINSG
jgi:hypothetical protein